MKPNFFCISHIFDILYTVYIFQVPQILNVEINAELAKHKHKRFFTYTDWMYL